MVDLINHVRAKVVDGRTTGDDSNLPCGVRRWGLGPVTIEVSLVVDDTAEGAVLDEFLEGCEVGIPPAIC